MSYNFYSLVSSIKDKVRVRDVVISVKINTSGNVILAAVVSGHCERDIDGLRVHLNWFVLCSRRRRWRL